MDDLSASLANTKRLKPRRLSILTDLAWEELDGHEVEVTDLSKYDLILSSRAWLMDDAHRKYLPLALAEARRRRYPKESA